MLYIYTYTRFDTQQEDIILVHLGQHNIPKSDTTLMNFAVVSIEDTLLSFSLQNGVLEGNADLNLKSLHNMLSRRILRMFWEVWLKDDVGFILRNIHILTTEPSCGLLGEPRQGLPAGTSRTHSHTLLFRIRSIGPSYGPFGPFGLLHRGIRRTLTAGYIQGIQ